mmetsp:Transcript_99916/g.243057  ORF Transcript_99916/g.243057 Transcript_99916/m.243057 type:complete len:134 (+) Transcript_99916:636-1037(+)
MRSCAIRCECSACSRAIACAFSACSLTSAGPMSSGRLGDLGFDGVFSNEPVDSMPTVTALRVAGLASLPGAVFLAVIGATGEIGVTVSSGGGRALRRAKLELLPEEKVPIWLRYGDSSALLYAPRLAGLKVLR